MVSSKTTQPRRHHQRGVTLLESIIALLMVGIGLLGVASMQVTGVKATYNADWRGRAGLIAQDLTDRMRANIDIARQGAYADGAATTNAISLADKVTWGALVSNDLPGGSATVSCAGACGFGALYTINISWDENRDGDNEASYVLEVTP